MKNLILSMIILTGICFSGSAQEKSRREKRGDKYSFIYAYDKAIKSYTHAKELTTDGQRKLAESYHKTDQNTKAETEYAKLVSLSNGVVAEDYYNYAMVLKNNVKYKEAGDWMDKFSSAKPNDLRAQNYRREKPGFSSILNDAGRFKVNLMEMNTDDDDFGPSYYKNQIVFTSSRSSTAMIKRTDNWTGKPFLNLYFSEIDGKQLKNPRIFSKNLNGKMNDGPASFSNNGTVMAFSGNNEKDKSKDKIVELQIYFSSMVDGKWSKRVPFVLNDKGYSVGHPSLTADGNTMYFASDMPGGFGGVDIYRIHKDLKGVWGKAENMGNTLNTEGDEMFPFYEEKNEILFFTSDGRFGLGGMDIFMCMLNGDAIGKVTNAGYPLNSQYDDFGIVVNEKLTSGYFSSNRSGGKGSDDIYSVDILMNLDLGKKIIGIAKDKNEEAIPGTFITLLDANGVIVDTFTTSENGAYAFLVESNSIYKLTGEKDHYTDGQNTVNTSGQEFVVNADVVLLTKKELISQVLVVGTDIVKVLDLHSIYFDFNHSDIRPDAEVVLDAIVEIMNDHPEMIVEIRSYTDSRANRQYNQILSDKRAVSSIDYIKNRITHPERISGSGYGESNLVNDCSDENNVAMICSEEEHQLNRRTEFIIVAK